LLDAPDTVKHNNFKRLQWAGLIVRMDNTRIPKSVLNLEFNGRRFVGRP